MFSVHISYFFTESDQKIVDEHGNLVPIAQLTSNGIIALRALEELPIEEKKEIRNYIFYKVYQFRERQMLEKENNKDKG
jgi:hypothetical protein